MPEAWAEWEADLAATLSGLREGEFLNTWGPTETEERPPGLFGRRRAPRVVSAPVVRFLVIEGVLLTESVAAFPTERDPRLSDEQRAQLSRAGWLMPGDEGYTAVGGDFLRVYVPQAEAARAAALATATYRILGVPEPGLIEQERGA